MNKREFLNYLRRKLHKYPKTEVDSLISYYNELICDTMEKNRINDVQAVNHLGDPKDAVAQCQKWLSEKNPKIVAKANMARTICLIVLSPIILALAIAIISVLFGLLITVAALIISFAVISLSGILVVIAAIIAPINIGVKFAIAGTGCILFAIFAKLAVWTGKGSSKLFSSSINVFKRSKN